MRLQDERSSIAESTGDGPTDQNLVARIAAGDRQAVPPLFHRYHDRLYRYLARMLRNEAMAEEIANEVFVEVWRSAARYRGESSVSTWMFGIARNRALSSLRKRREAELDSEHAESIADTAETPAEALESKSSAQELRRCMNQLSDDHREVIQLTYFQEMPIREIAELLGIPENTVKTRMFHARRRLKEIIEAAQAGGGLQ